MELTEVFSCLKVVEMPSEDLGAPAYRKFDILAWMPAKAVYGEISSTSNCTDYQARRLNIRYRRANAPVAKNRSQGEKDDCDALWLGFGDRCDSIAYDFSSFGDR